MTISIPYPTSETMDWLIPAICIAAVILFALRIWFMGRSIKSLKRNYLGINNMFHERMNAQRCSFKAEFLFQKKRIVEIESRLSDIEKPQKEKIKPSATDRAEE